MKQKDELAEVIEEELKTNESILNHIEYFRNYKTAEAIGIITKAIATKLRELGYVRLDDVTIDDDKLLEIVEDTKADYVPCDWDVNIAKSICLNKKKIIKVKK